MSATTGNGQAPLLEVENLVTRFPVPRGHRRRGHRPAEARRPRGRRRLLLASARARCSRSSASPGSGKTTTAQSILRLVEPESGAIRFQGEDITKRPDRQAARAPAARCSSSSRTPTSRSTRASACATTVEEPLLIHGEGGDAEEREERVRDALDAGGPDAAGALPRPLPARALRRPAPARRHRREPRPRPAAPRRRRARLDARRVGPRRDPLAPRRAAPQRASGSS